MTWKWVEKLFASNKLEGYVYKSLDHRSETTGCQGKYNISKVFKVWGVGPHSPKEQNWKKVEKDAD